MLTTEKTVENQAPKQHKSKKSLNYRLHTDFKRIKRHVLEVLASGKVPVNGICYHISKVDGDVFSGLSKEFLEVKEEAYEAWSLYSGDPTYPIASSSALLTAHHSYMDHRTNSTLWAGEQLELRISLLDHLIEFFKPPVMPRTALLKLLRVDMQAEGYNHSEGICGAVYDAFLHTTYVKKVYIVVRDARRALSPQTSLYPIPFGTLRNEKAFDKHRVAGTLWVGGYGAARKAYALKLADYIAEHYTVHLNPVKQESRVQKIFKKVIAAGYYSFAGSSPKTSIYMCHALDKAARGDVITWKERELAFSELKEYMKNPHGTHVMVNCLYYAGLLKVSDTQLSKNQRVLMHLYKNWDKRPKLVY